VQQPQIFLRHRRLQSNQGEAKVSETGHKYLKVEVTGHKRGMLKLGVSNIQEADNELAKE
jgi:hypothetical protein